MQKILLNLTREEFMILLNSMQLYKIAMTYLNYVNTVDESNSFTDVLFYNMTTKTDEEMEICFIYSEPSILIVINALVIYKKILSLLNEKELYKLTNSLILKLKSINTTE